MSCSHSPAYPPTSHQELSLACTLRTAHSVLQIGAVTLTHRACERLTRACSQPWFLPGMRDTGEGTVHSSLATRLLQTRRSVEPARSGWTEHLGLPPAGCSPSLVAPVGNDSR